MIFSAALLALPFVASAFAAKECARTYTVQVGDICDSISAAKNVSTYQIAAINSAKINAECTNLAPGTELCLGYAGEDCTSTYTVVAGDSCEKVAANNRLNTTMLYANNPQIDSECSNIYVGEVLCIADKVQVPPTPAGPLPGATIPVTAAPANPSATQHQQTPAAPKPDAPKPAAPKPTAPQADNNDDEDDDDLPYCDEL